ncbi:putative cyclin-dependent kinase F-2 [Dichanthelium oligosanthes]|uniref:[RNA-polymerase]-subunit kinase n=1 Tax=Dichanthelium oligosanthes TaxID=888268 RepID=A0A1E5VSN1_9POAL|nr:putative cyclin-dependent kinase F-2 [Dichanthelium oligosanthes]
MTTARQAGVSPPPPLSALTATNQESSRIARAAMEHYERLGKIAEGASGIVYKARDRRTGETVAIKRLRAGGGNGDGDAFAETFLREARCLEACRGHPCLVELRAAHRDDDASAGAFLVMEYAGRSLAEVVREDRAGRRPFPEAQVRLVVRRLLEGAAAMHARGVLHRDLKPDNVLLDGRGGVKICDFGLSRAADTDACNAPYTPGVATLWYRAPELILGSRDYDAGVDTWALGCIMAELLAGAPLFPGRSEMDQLNRVFDTLGMQDMRSWPGFARLPRAESGLCHRSRPPSRLREMFPALSAAGFDVLSGLLACRPDRRLTAAEALRCPWFAEAAAPEAMAADQLRASCAASLASSVAGVPEAIVA